MDDHRVGAMFRAVRVRRGFRQVDLAARAGTSSSTVSRIEHGRFESLSLAVLRSIARQLDIRVDLAPWSRRGDLHRMASADHSALVEALVQHLVGLGWAVRPEASFSESGERGYVDILAWHAPSGTLLVIEVKTEIVDVGELLGTLDRKERLARRIAARMGWEPTVVSLALVVHDSRMNRRRVAEHRSTFGAVLPSDGRVLRAHLRHPRGGRIAAVAFWSILRPGGTRHAGGGIRRVRTARPAPIRAQPRSQTLL